jgi:hypothetical protein
MTKAEEVRLSKNMSGFAAKAHNMKIATRIPREIIPPNSMKTRSGTLRFFDVTWENELPLYIGRDSSRAAARGIQTSVGDVRRGNL